MKKINHVNSCIKKRIIKLQTMGKSCSHSRRSNFNYVLKQLNKSDIFDLFETKNGILIKNKFNIDNQHNNQYIIHTDSKKLHELRRWLKREYGFILDLKN